MASSLFIVGLFLAVAFGYCPGQNFLNIPADPSARGPWPVGARTVYLTSRNLTTEIWYPAIPGSERNRNFAYYSVRDQHLPPRQANKIPDEADPLQYCDCYNDLPIDQTRGPFPIHLHVHGTAAFRHASLEQMTHYASRGFVVVAADHPGITLYDMLELSPGGPQTDQTGDAYKLLEELKSLADPQLAFLKGRVDSTRIALSGHSAGGSAIRPMGDIAQVLMSWTAGGTSAGPLLKSSLILAAEDDGYDRRIQGYESSPASKRFVGIADAGHVAPTSLCRIGEEDGGLVAIALKYDVYLAYLLQPLIGNSCDPGQVYNEAAWNIVNYSTAGVQEEILMCRAEMTEALAKISAALPHVKDYFESL